MATISAPLGSASNAPISNMFDGNNATIWHSLNTIFGNKFVVRFHFPIMFSKLVIRTRQGTSYLLAKYSRYESVCLYLNDIFQNCGATIGLYGPDDDGQPETLEWITPCTPVRKITLSWETTEYENVAQIARLWIHYAAIGIFMII